MTFFSLTQTSMQPTIAQPTAKRSDLLDILKGLLIISVVVGHCIQYGSGEQFLRSYAFFEHPLFKFIYSFHMPLFMVICGYLFGFSIRSRSWQQQLKNRARQLLIPITVWATIIFAEKFIGAHFVDGEPITGSVWSILNRWFNSITGNLWFLWAVFYNTLIVIFVNRILKDSLWAYVAIFVLSFIVPKAALYCFMYPYFVMGYLYCKYLRESNFIAETMRYRWILTIGVSLLFAAMLHHFGREDYVYTTGTFILRGGKPLQQLGIDLFRLAIGAVGSLSIIAVTNELYRLVGCRLGILTYLGRKTMGIYIFSSYLIGRHLGRVIEALGVDSANYGDIALESVAVIAICLALISLTERNKTARLLLLGQ